MKHALAARILPRDVGYCAGILLALLFLVSLPTSVAGAAEDPAGPATDAKKAEAAQRFERGLRLFDTNDNEGALAEFRRTYQIMPNPLVLYNIGLVFAAMRRPVDAVDALERALNSGALPPEQIERAQQTLLEQRARVGRLMVTTTPEGARVELDNIVVAKTPLEHPIKISEGRHIVSVVAEGFAPASQEVIIAGNSDATVHLDLLPTQSKRQANLNVRTRTVGAEVVVDGKVVGKTPLASSVTLAAGRHVVELRRAGYVTARRELEMGEGATGDFAAELTVDSTALIAEGATLVLDSSESPLEVSIDGERKGIYQGPLRLPRGPHHLTVTAPGFIPFEREIALSGTETNVVRVVLEPTAETREQYRSRAHFHRTWGWIGIASGVLIAGGGTALGVVSSSQKKDAADELVAINALYENDQPPCDWRSAYQAEASNPPGQRGDYLCEKAKGDAQSKFDGAKTRQLLGYVGAGVGGAVAITGVVLLLTGDDPDKYEHLASPSLGVGKGTRVTLIPGPGDIGYGLQVTF